MAAASACMPGRTCSVDAAPLRQAITATAAHRQTTLRPLGEATGASVLAARPTGSALILAELGAERLQVCQLPRSSFTRMRGGARGWLRSRRPL